MKLLLLFLVCFNMGNSQPNVESCSEYCYMVRDDARQFQKNFLEELLEIVNDLRTLKLTHNFDRVGFLIQSGLGDEANQPMQPNHWPTDTKGNQILFYQFLISIVISFGLQIPTFYVQFDDTNAWTCLPAQCVSGYCGNGAFFNVLTLMNMNENSWCPGNIDAACNLMNYINNQPLECAANLDMLLVAITNHEIREPNSNKIDEKCLEKIWGSSSGSGSRSSSSSSSSSSSGSSSNSDSMDNEISACELYFPIRYIVGTYKASKENALTFASDLYNYNYLRFDDYTTKAVLDVADCTAQTCCLPPRSADRNETMFTVATKMEKPNRHKRQISSTCIQTEGHEGESIIDYPDHPLFTGNTFIQFFA